MADKKQKTHSFRSFFLAFLSTKILKWVVLALIIIGLVTLGIGSHLKNDSKSTTLGLQDIEELATQAAYVTEVGEIEDLRTLFGAIDIPFTQSHYIYSQDFVIKAGFENIKSIRPKINKATKTITFTLPEPIILSNQPKKDSFKVFLEKESIFNQITLDEQNQQFEVMRENAEKSAIDNGILEGAKQNVETLIKSMFSADYNENEWTYSFQYKGA